MEPTEVSSEVVDCLLGSPSGTDAGSASGRLGWAGMLSLMT